MDALTYNGRSSYDEIVLKYDFSLFFYLFLMLLYVRSTKGIKRLTKEERSFFIISNNTEKALIGIMLSDGHVSRRTKTSNPRFHFCQSGIIQKRFYFYLVYDLFKIYCSKDYSYYVITWIDKKISRNIHLLISLLCNCHVLSRYIICDI